MKLFLFDLDGTLVTTGGAGMRALARTFEHIFGIKEAMKTIRPAGKTDPAIFREMFQVHFNRDMERHDFDSITGKYLEILVEEMKTTPKKNPLPGVVGFLDHLATRNDILLALGTGNLEKGARIKLESMNLNPYFSFGGFGSDAEDRSEVLGFGRRRAEKILGRAIPAESVFVIGDTPLDVGAARKAGFRAVGVAGGGATLEALAASSPDYLWQDMTAGFEFLKQLDHVSLGA